MIFKWDEDEKYWNGATLIISSSWYTTILKQ